MDALQPEGRGSLHVHPDRFCALSRCGDHRGPGCTMRRLAARQCKPSASLFRTSPLTTSIGVAGWRLSALGQYTKAMLLSGMKSSSVLLARARPVPRSTKVFKPIEGATNPGCPSSEYLRQKAA